MSANLERGTADTHKASKVATAAITYDPTTRDVGNIVLLDHFSLCVSDQMTAMEFYVMGLGLTRDPYMRVGSDRMGINIGRSQFHLGMSGAASRGRTRPTQRVRGTIGLVLPDLDELKKRLERVVPALKNTQFKYQAHADSVEVTCPWGNRFLCHAPSPQYGNAELSVAYIEFNVPRGTAEGIARFYREALLAPAIVEQHGGDSVASIDVGVNQKLLFHETDAPLPPHDGHHINIYVANYSNPYRFFSERNCIIDGSLRPFKFSFANIIDVDSGKVLFEIEHEVRPMKHPEYDRPLVNRDPAHNSREYAHEAFRGRF